MAENAEHAAAHNLQERVNTIELKMEEVKKEQDQVKLALKGEEAYLGMTREVLVRAVCWSRVLTYLCAACMCHDVREAAQTWRLATKMHARVVETP